MDINAPGGRDPSAINATPEVATVDIRHLSASELQRLGLSQIAYVKPVVVNGAQVFAIHGADGTPMALAADRDLAFAAIIQHDMAPALVH
ncbi:MAG TPA: DUF1150 family protein [Acetobacteraceae bacterium]|nr:DUF1150 family protein [Acetobacteraceae bacterium]